jgi:hypothetical protein
MNELTYEQWRELRHIAIVTAPELPFHTHRTPRSNVTPLVRAGYVIEHPIQKDFYQVTPAGIAALESKDAS